MVAYSLFVITAASYLGGLFVFLFVLFILALIVRKTKMPYRRLPAPETVPAAGPYWERAKSMTDLRPDGKKDARRYDINIAKNGVHVFATDSAIRSYTPAHVADMIQMFKGTFPVNEGYQISVIAWFDKKCKALDPAVREAMIGLGTMFRCVRCGNSFDEYAFEHCDTCDESMCPRCFPGHDHIIEGEICESGVRLLNSSAVAA